MDERKGRQDSWETRLLNQLPALTQPSAEPLSPVDADFLCPACFWVGSPQSRPRGSVVIESLLWGFGFVIAGLMVVGEQSSIGLACLPGPVYSVWRRYRRPAACPQCGTHPLVPEDAAYPPACSHFLFSAEPKREENRPWSATGTDVASQPTLTDLEPSSHTR